MPVAARVMERTRSADGALEAAKWIAFACMVVDHANKVLFAGDLGEWATVVGRIAFPVFALVLGWNIARPGVDLPRIANRLALWGLIATPVYALALGAFPLNVLFSFAVSVFIVDMWRRGYFLAAFAALMLGTVLVDYAFVGPALVLGAWQWRHERPIALVALAGGFWGLFLVNGNAWGLLGPLVLGVCLLARPGVPRVGRAFYWAYVGHIAALVAIRYGVAG